MSAEFTSKNGFSVVAPTSTSTRFSTAWRSASCWLRLNRWISSTSRMVREPLSAKRFSAASISRRRADTVPPMADTSTNVAFVDSDDWVSPKMYEKMLDTGADVTLCDYVRFQGKTETPFTPPTVNAGFYDKAQMREKIYPHLVMDGIEYPITISNWALLIKRDIIVKNQLSYREDIHVREEATLGSEVQ